MVGQVLGARGDIQFEEDGSDLTIVDGQTEIDVTFLYEKVFDDYFIDHEIELPVASLTSVQLVIRKEDRKTTGFKVQIIGHVPAGSIYRWHIKVRDALQVTQPPESQPRYVLAGAYQPVNDQLTMLSTLPVTDFGLGSLNLADADAFRTYIGAATSSEFGGPYVPTSRTITEGAGLAGNTYSLAANRTLAMGTPSTLTVAMTNSVSGTTHSHAITSSSNPGAAASLLASDSSGRLGLTRLTVTDYLFINNATANIYLKDTSTGFQAATTTILTPLANNSLRTTVFSSGLIGWNINAAGDAEFNNLRVRGEIAASVFKVSELSATAGTFGVFYSASTLTADCTTPNVLSTSFTFHAKNSDANAMLFALGDILRIKGWTGAGIQDSWATVTARTNNGVSTTYVATLNSGSTGATFTAGTAVVDYGPSGTGFITLSTDGTVGSSPNMTMAVHSGTPWNGFTTLMRSGNLNGSYGYASDVYGVGIGNYAASASWITFDTTNGIRIGNNTSTLAQWGTSGDILIGQYGVVGLSWVSISAAGGLQIGNNASILAQWDSSGNILIGKNGAGEGNVFITSGSLQMRVGTTVFGQWDTSGNAAFGNVATNQANVFWNNSNKHLEFRGSTNGTVVQSYIDTDGSFVSGGGAVKLNATGLVLDPTLSLYSTGSSVNWIRQSDSAKTAFINDNQLLNGSGVLSVRKKLPADSPLGLGQTELSAVNDDNSVGTYMTVNQKGSGIGNAGYITTFGTSGFLGMAVGDNILPTQMLDVRGRMFLQNSTAPSTPTGGVVIYAEGGAVKAKGSSGTVTTIAPA